MRSPPPPHHTEAYPVGGAAVEFGLGASRLCSFCGVEQGGGCRGPLGTHPSSPLGATPLCAALHCRGAAASTVYSL